MIKKRIAITGANGYIGQKLINKLEKHNYKLSLLFRSSDNILIENKHKHRIVIGNLSDKASLEQLLKDCSLVINLAGEYTHEKLMMDSNYYGVKALFDVIEKLGIPRFIHLSTVGVYGRPTHGLFDENAPFSGINSYEKSKVLSENYFLNKNSKQTDIIILRPSNVFGPKMKNNSLREMFLNISRGTFFFIGKKGAIVNYLYIDNLVNSITTIINDKKSSNNGLQVFNLNQEATLEEFVSYFSSKTEKHKSFLRLQYTLTYFIAYLFDLITILFKFKFPLTRSRISALTSRATFSQKKFEKLYDYRHEYTLEQGIQECINIWKKP